MSDRWLDPKEAAAYTGYCIRTLERAVEGGLLKAGRGITPTAGKGPTKKLALHRRFKISELDRWLVGTAA